MMPIISFLIMGIILGAAAIVSAFLWSWSLFGDIWHQNGISEMWAIPLVVIFIANIFCVWFSPRVIHGLEIHWWHYAAAIAGFLIVGIAIILYIRGV